MPMTQWWAWLVANPLLAWGCAAFGAWLLLGWGRRRYREYQARRRRRAFDAREMRRWEGHRRERR